MLVVVNINMLFFPLKGEKRACNHIPIKNLDVQNALGQIRMSIY